MRSRKAPPLFEGLIFYFNTMQPTENETDYELCPELQKEMKEIEFQNQVHIIYKAMPLILLLGGTFLFFILTQ